MKKNNCSYRNFMLMQIGLDFLSKPSIRMLLMTIQLSLLGVVGGCQSSTDSSVLIDRAATNSIRMGQGYNSLGGVSYSSEMSYCAAKSPLVPLGGSTGETVVLYIASAKSEKSLQEELTKSLSDGLEYGTNNDKKDNPVTQSVNDMIGKFDVSSKRENQTVYREKSVYVVVRARKTFSNEALSELNVADNINKFFSDRPQEFFSRCGDRFVSGLKKGAEITAYMRCETSSQEMKEKIADTINASAGLKGVSSKATIEAVLAKVRQQTAETCTYSFMPQGGSGTIRIDSDKEFVDSALAYLAAASPATAVPIEFETMPYSAILDKDFHDSILKNIDLKLVSQRDYVQKKSDTISLLSHQIGRLLDLGQTSPTMIGPLIQAMEKTRVEVDRCLRDVYNPEACAAKAKWPIHRPKSPQS